jgi:hypothetical protein
MSGNWPKASALRAYRTAAGLGASPDGFMKMALDSARNLLLRAETAIDAGAQVEKAQALASASTLVEFMLGLTGTDPGELSECLASVYNTSWPQSSRAMPKTIGKPSPPRASRSTSSPPPGARCSPIRSTRRKAALRR